MGQGELQRSQVNIVKLCNLDSGDIVSLRRILFRYNSKMNFFRPERNLLPIKDSGHRHRVIVDVSLDKPTSRSREMEYKDVIPGD